jgi:hypothetical protein
MLASQVKVVGTNGQLSLGKQFAGKMVRIDQVDEGTWLIKSGEFMPDSEKWLHTPESIAKLEKALAWSEKNAPQDNFEQQIKGLERGSNKNRSQSSSLSKRSISARKI